MNTAPVNPDHPRHPRRVTRSGAELGRARILALLANGEAVGLDWLAEQALMSRRTARDRLRELADLVAFGEQPEGCPMVRLRE
jgi:hypothetical protein